MKLRPFELALVIFFGALAIGALVLINIGKIGGGPETEENYIGSVSIWGTLPTAAVNTVIQEITASNEVFGMVRYTYIPPESFNERLITALADGIGPDMLFISQEQLVEQRRRIQPRSYESWPYRDFQDTYLDGAQIFALSDGIYGQPILVDPLMMYWNRDVLTTNDFLSPPKTWEELVNVQLPVLIERSFDRTINRGVVALGVYDNTENAFGVLSTLLIQTGSGLVSETTTNNDVFYNVQLNNTRDANDNTLLDSLSFYLRFGQPTNALYSWNRSFSSDLSEFISEDLVFYFGYGSEGREIQALNPNLRFDIAEVPQSASADVRRTYGRFYALAPLRSAKNLSGAFTVANTFSSDAVMLRLAQETNMVPTKRNLVIAGTNDIYTRVAYRSAPIAYGWLNPDMTQADTAFEEMVSDVNENRSSVGRAANETQIKISRMYD